MYTLIELETKTTEWAEARGIIKNGKAETQALKLIEEFGETVGCILKKKDPKDGIGDCMVVLCNLSALCGIPLNSDIHEDYEGNSLFFISCLLGVLGMAILEQEKEDIKLAIGTIYHFLEVIAKDNDTSVTECWNLAYEEIKDRKGYLTPEGNFIKESDNV